ncbi:MAG: alpha-amylase family glycosyl hydrolase, partial [Saprospiraceae bacterium]
MKNLLILTLCVLVIGAVFFFTACQNAPKEEQKAAPVTFEKPRVPEWHKNATIYEVNLRHYTQEGTFKSFEAQIPRLKEMGIDILWFMPINPVSVKNRKGELGSPYAVADYKATNPDYGTMDDFKHLVEAIHAAGMHIIIDWVPNHTGWDNPWITEHKDWYTQDAAGNVIDPIDPETGKSWGWTDVADLNYDNKEMRLAMIDAMKFWVTEAGIDGFRVDVAHNVPIDFWAECSDTLYAVKPLFLLAEAEVPAIRNNGAFVMDYAWGMHHLLNQIAEFQGAKRGKTETLVKGNKAEGAKAKIKKKTALDIDALLAEKATEYSKGYFMQFTSNHDENSWSGTEFARMGDGHKAFAVLTATFNGMPLLYSGMESAMDKQLEFFKRDVINWGDYKYAGFYKTLFDLKHRNKALWNGTEGGALVKIPSGNDENTYAFLREKDGDKVLVIINLSSKEQDVKLQGSNFAGTYKDVFAGKDMEVKDGTAMKMKAWDYLVLSN